MQYRKAKELWIQEHLTSFTPDGVRGVWYVGPPGTGKSRKAFEENPGAYRKA